MKWCNGIVWHNKIITFCIVQKSKMLTWESICNFWNVNGTNKHKIILSSSLVKLYWIFFLLGLLSLGLWRESSSAWSEVLDSWEISHPFSSLSHHRFTITQHINNITDKIFLSSCGNTRSIGCWWLLQCLTWCSSAPPSPSTSSPSSSTTTGSSPSSTAGDTRRTFSELKML